MNNKNPQPIGSRVLIKLPPSVKKEVKGLIQLEVDHAYQQTGEVVSMGKGRIGKKGNRVPMDVNIGDKVYITKFAGIQIKFDGIEHLMVFHEDIVGVFN